MDSEFTPALHQLPPGSMLRKRYRLGPVLGEGGFGITEDGYAPGTFAHGGLLYGPTYALAGEYPGARNNPEVIAPLDKLKGILRDAIDFTSVIAPLQAVQPSTLGALAGGSNRSINQYNEFSQSFACTESEMQPRISQAAETDISHIARLISVAE